VFTELTRPSKNSKYGLKIDNYYTPVINNYAIYQKTYQQKVEKLPSPDSFQNKL